MSTSYVDVTPVDGVFRKRVTIPGSKSITNRALPLAALAEGRSELSGVLFADDTRVMIGALKSLGLKVEVDEAGRRVVLEGRGTDFPNKSAEIFCGNSGTTIRFLSAMLSLSRGMYTLDGIARMRERPIGELVDELRKLGAEIGYQMKEGYPPIKISGRGLSGGDCRFEDAESSQFISAILMAAPYAGSPVRMQLAGPITSEPYVTMTLRMMEQWGCKSVTEENSPEGKGFAVGGAKYSPRTYAIEPDASNASYFLAAAAVIKDASITVEGLGKGSLQGDVAFADVLHQMGAGLAFGRDFVTVTGTGELRGIEIDMNHIPDMVQTLAVVALFAEGETRVTNVWNLRVKETDRLAALENELRKLGATVETGRDWIRIVPPKGNVITPASIETYDDHRMAMAFSVAGLRGKGVRILNPGCTGKTYPNFFSDLATAVS